MEPAIVKLAGGWLAVDETEGRAAGTLEGREWRVE
jgi:hypothetical protein